VFAHLDALRIYEWTRNSLFGFAAKYGDTFLSLSDDMVVVVSGSRDEKDQLSEDGGGEDGISWQRYTLVAESLWVVDYSLGKVPPSMKSLLLGPLFKTERPSSADFLNVSFSSTDFPSHPNITWKATDTTAESFQDG